MLPHTQRHSNKKHPWSDLCFISVWMQLCWGGARSKRWICVYWLTLAELRVNMWWLDATFAYQPPSHRCIECGTNFPRQHCRPPILESKSQWDEQACLNFLPEFYLPGMDDFPILQPEVTWLVTLIPPAPHLQVTPLWHRYILNSVIIDHDGQNINIFQPEYLYYTIIVQPEYLYSPTRI